MVAALRVVQAVVSLSFLSLGLLTVVDWLRHPERSRGYLALAFSTLGLTSVLSQVNTVTDYRLGTLLEDVVLLLFMTSGYAMLLFRDAFIPLSRRIRMAALAATVVVTVVAIAAGLSPNPEARQTLFQSIAALALVLVWSSCVMEPVVRFWMASRTRPSVQRARLRALAGGYAAIVVILLIAGFGGSSVNNPAVQWLFEIVALIALPLLFVSFAPPRWLRRLWWEREADEFREAVHDLVLFSPDRPTLAKRAAEWGIRLVGADGIAIVDADGTTLALRGMDADVAQRLAAQRHGQGRPTLLTASGSGRQNVIVVPLPLDLGTGAMVVVGGPFTPFFGTDEASRLRGYAANITAALDRIRVTERLAALDKMKSQFLNLASHELRSPLAVINGYLSMLEQGSFGQLKESGLRALEVLKAKTLEMNLLVAQLLDAARLEDGQLSLKRAQVDLREITREALDVVRPMAGPHHQLSLETPVEEVLVFGDRDRLLTIVTNLLENAVKYSPDGGAVRCVVSAAGKEAAVSVSDAGIGIADEDLPRLFNRFERIPNRQTSHVGGTGLGLYLSRELAHQHTGEITVESRLGEGSTFTLTLPLTRPLPQTAKPEPSTVVEAVPATPRLHVLTPENESESRLA